MKFAMTRQEKSDLLMQVTELGFKVIIYYYIMLSRNMTELGLSVIYHIMLNRKMNLTTSYHNIIYITINNL
jgi:hypothetical protein